MIAARHTEGEDASSISPPVTPPRSIGHVVRGVGGGIGFVVVATVLPLLRQEGVPIWRTVWAEDGTVYASAVLSDGARAVLFRCYAGYLELVPRLLASPVGHLPASWLPSYLTVASALVAALLALLVLRCTRGWIRSWPIRLVVAASVVVAPTLGTENLPGITNVIWAFLAALPWVLIATVERPHDVFGRSLAGFLAATSTLLSVVFVPLALGWVFCRRTKASAIVAGTYLFGVVVEVAVSSSAADQLSSSPKVSNSMPDLFSQFGVRVLGELLLGNRPIGGLWLDHGVAFIAGCLILTVALLAGLLVGAGRREQALALVLAVYAIVVFVVPTWGRGTSAVGVTQGVYNEAGMRYAVVPVLLLLSAIAVLCDPVGPARRQTRPFANAMRWVLVVQVIVVMATSFRVSNSRSVGPDTIDDLEWRHENQCPEQPPGTKIQVLISPPGWVMDATCGWLDH